MARYKFDSQPTTLRVASALGVDITAIAVAQNADGSWELTSEHVQDREMDAIVQTITTDPNADIVDVVADA